MKPKFFVTMGIAIVSLAIGFILLADVQQNKQSEPNQNIKETQSAEQNSTIPSTVVEPIQNSSKTQLTKNKVNEELYKLIDICYPKTDPMGALSCKEKFIQMKDDCKREEFSTIPACNDPRISQIISKEIPDITLNNISDITNKTMTNFIENCLRYSDQGLISDCKEKAQQILEICNYNSTVTLCSEPRLQEISKLSLESPGI